MRLPLLLALVSAFAACSSDPTDGNPPAPQDAQPTDIGQDATDVQRVDVGEDRPAPMDAGADAGFDVGFEAALQELPAPDAGDSGTADAASDVAADRAGDAATDVPEDVRISCGSLPTEPACTTSAMCAMCQPASSGEVWCCRPNGTCGVTPGVFACP